MSLYTATKRLWLTLDRERVVEDGHPEARFLFLAEGEEMDAEEAAKFGLKSEAPRGDKKGSKPEDKTGAKPTDKEE